MATDDLTTKPTIDTILERLAEFRVSVETRLERSSKEMEAFRIEVEDRLDGIEKQVVVIRKDQLDMRMELRALHIELKEHLPLLK